MAIFHQELGQVCTTMYLQGSAADNTVCKMHANDTVAACAAGNDFIGVVVGKRDGLACVQVAGFVTLHYTGTTAPTVGECALAGDGKGGVEYDRLIDRQLERAAITSISGFGKICTEAAKVLEV